MVNLLNPQQQEYLKEVGTYLQSESGAWAIGEEHIELLVYLLGYVFFSLKKVSMITYHNVLNLLT